MKMHKLRSPPARPARSRGSHPKPMKMYKLPRNFPADALLLTTGDAAYPSDANFLYWAGFEVDNAFLILPRDSDPILLVHEMNLPFARSKTKFHVEPYKKGESHKKLASLLKPFRSLAISKRDLSANFHETLENKIFRRRIIDVSDLLLEQRMIKSDEEIGKIHKACQLARKALASLEIKPGKTEQQLHDEFLHSLLNLHASPSFRPIVLAGPNAAYPHGFASTRRIKPNQLVLFDIGAKFENYCSDITRIFFAGKAPNPQEEKLYCAVIDVADECADFIRPGMRASRVMKFCQEQMKEKGLPLMPHGLGHGIGLEVHEPPYLHLESNSILRENMVFTIEPGYYVPGKYGFRYENTVLLKRGVKRL